MAKNSYMELKHRQQREVDAFPIGFAFSKEQFDEQMIKLGLKPTDTDKIYSIGGINVYLYNNKYGRFVTRFSAGEAKDYVSPLDYYTEEVDAVKKALPAAKQRIGF